MERNMTHDSNESSVKTIDEIKRHLTTGFKAIGLLEQIVKCTSKELSNRVAELTSEVQQMVDTFPKPDTRS
jgi:hypothetical protein